jgi:hypothetical protein
MVLLKIMNREKVVNNIILYTSLSGIVCVFLHGPTIRFVIEAIFNYICLYIFLKNFKIYLKINRYNNKYFIVFFVYSLIVFVYGCFVAQSYVQWRYLFTVYVPSLIFPFIIELCNDFSLFLLSLKKIMKYTLPLSILLYITDIGKGGMGDFTHFVSPLYLFLLLVPFVKQKIKIFFFILSLISLFYDLDSRSNVLNIIFCYLLIFTFYLSRYVKFFVFKILTWILLFAPIVFFILGISGVFNIFKMGDEYTNVIEIKNGEKEIALTGDSRTPIYIDALTSLTDPQTIIFGISPAGYSKTSLSEIYEDAYVYGRLGTESGFLKYLLCGGIVYIIIIFLIYLSAAYKSIYFSNNDLSKLLGIFVAFRWLFLFIEGEPLLNIGNLAIFISIGACFSNELRSMTNQDISKAFLKNL